MDKVVDAGNLVSLVNGSKPETAGKQGDATSGDVFSRVLEKETGKNEKTAEKTREVIASDKKDDKGKATAKTRSNLHDHLQGHFGKEGADNGSMANYIYNIVLKDPATLTMDEKQAYHLGEYAPDGVGLKEFQKLLNDRGIRLSALSFTQIAQLTRRNSRGTITAFLDDLRRQMNEGTFEHQVRPPVAAQGQEQDEDRSREKGERQGAEAQSLLERPAHPPLARNLTAPPPAQPPQTAADLQERREQRERVLNQIISHIEMRRVGDRTEMTLKLNPEYLGDLRVKLSSEKGKLSAQFETTSPEVRELIEEGWDGLKDTFTRKGLNLTEVSTRLVETIA